MKNKFSELTNLINMMTATEKRRFSAEYKSGLHSKNAQLPVGLIIFQILGAMNEFDEAVFYKKLKKAIADPVQLKKVTARLPVERLNLQERLMPFLRSENAGHYPSMQIKELLIDAKILLERGLFDLSQQALDKAREKALQYENSLALLEINREQRTLLHSRVDTTRTQKAMLAELTKEKETQFKLLEEEWYYQELYDWISFYSNKTKGIIENEDMMNKLRQAEHLLDQLDRLPNLSGLRLLGAFSNWANTRSDKRAFHEFTQLIAQWWEKRPQLIAENPFRYMTNMGNALSTMALNKENEGFLRLRDKLRKQVALLPHQELAEFRFVNRLELSWYLNNKKLDQACLKAKDIEIGLKKYGSVMPPRLRITTAYNCGVAYFLNGKFEEALAVFSRLKRYKHPYERRDLQYQAELLGLICVYENSVNKNSFHPSEDQGSDPLDSRFRRVNRLFRRDGLTDASLEMTLLARHRQIMYANWGDRKEAVVAMKDCLDQHIRENPGKEIPGVGEHLAWLGSLAQSKEIRQIYLEMPG